MSNRNPSPSSPSTSSSLPPLPPPLERIPIGGGEDDASSFFAGAASKEAINRVDREHLKKVSSTSSLFSDPRYIYAITIVIIALYFGSQHLNTIPKPNMFEHYIPTDATILYENIVWAGMYVFQFWVDVFTGSRVVLTEGVNGPTKSRNYEVEKQRLLGPWATTVDANITQFSTITVNDQMMLDEYVMKVLDIMCDNHARGAYDPQRVVCAYQFNHSLAVTPYACCTVGATRVSNPYFNIQIHGYGKEKVTIPETPPVICGGKTQTKTRRKSIEISYLMLRGNNKKLSDTPIRTLILDEQEAFEFQMHIDVMNDKYTCQ